MGLKKYYSRFIVTDYAFYPDPPYKGKGWFISFEDDPSIDSNISRQSAHINDQIYPGKAVVIRARSVERAQYVADMIFASLCLNLGELPPFDRTRVLPIDPSSSEHTDKQGRWMAGPTSVNMGDLPQAFIIAAKASHRRAYQYALFKHLLSHQIFSTSIMDLDPSHWWPTRFVFASAEHHVRCAYAILVAYSILEELSLELRATQENPSTIGGKWNPKVKGELEARLRKAGVDLSETILWTMRDTPTKIERTRPPRIQSKAEWAGWKVRDSELEVIDAIAYASWLRSKLSAHRLRELAGSLNYYDVANVQHLARRLLLERLGFWPRYESS
jgi:hypothetical protein